MKQYKELLIDVMQNGVEKTTRNGKVKSVFGRTFKHDMNKGFPLLTTKKMYWKGIVTELLWFLRGDTNIKFLVDNDCHIWDGDAFKNYIEKERIDFSKVLPENYKYAYNSKMKEFINNIKASDEFAKKWGSLGKIYGHGWRNWNGKSDDELYEEFLQKLRTDKEFNNEFGNKGIDQIQNLINDLKTNPDSRRLMVNAWNVGELDQMVLPPCHYSFQVYTRELTWNERCRIVTGKDLPFDELNNSDKYKIDYMHEHNIPTRAISLMWNQRSVDTFLGLPFNIASYGLLLEIIAKEVNMVPDQLIGNLGDVHIYEEHYTAVNEQLSREPFPLKKLSIKSTGTSILMSPELVTFDNFEILDYTSHPKLTAPLKC